MKVFTVVEHEEATLIENEARTRGLVLATLVNLTSFYEIWAADEANHREDGSPKSFLVALNKSEGDPFVGKKTDSLYTSFNTAINKNDYKQSWRVIKKTHKAEEGSGEEDQSVLYIAHL